MNAASWIILSIVIVIAIVATIFSIKRSKGGCSCCEKEEGCPFKKIADKKKVHQEK